MIRIMVFQMFQLDLLHDPRRESRCSKCSNWTYYTIQGENHGVPNVTTGPITRSTARITVFQMFQLDLLQDPRRESQCSKCSNWTYYTIHGENHGVPNVPTGPITRSTARITVFQMFQLDLLHDPRRESQCSKCSNWTYYTIQGQNHGVSNVPTRPITRSRRCSN